MDTSTLQRITELQAARRTVESAQGTDSFRKILLDFIDRSIDVTLYKNLRAATLESIQVELDAGADYIASMLIHNRVPEPLYASALDLLGMSPGVGCVTGTKR